MRVCIFSGFGMFHIPNLFVKKGEEKNRKEILQVLQGITYVRQLDIQRNQQCLRNG